ncbi:MAG: type II toxin-antitoxin system HicB family antitoxin [Syntrophomonadaceae bacterium]|nr:type II toxin-antitoxin system HicB family antitoxin [Syntrophomonadaceae bacterium]
MADKDFEYYLSLPYKIVLYPSPEGGYAIEIPELPGCLTQGQTIEEAMLMIEDAKRAWIDIALQDGEFIPEPDSINNYSGKLNIRIPKSLHKSLAERAKQEKVSLNQFILHKLSAKS